MGLDCLAFWSKGELNYSCINSPDTLKLWPPSLLPLWLFSAYQMKSRLSRWRLEAGPAAEVYEGQAQYVQGTVAICFSLTAVGPWADNGPVCSPHPEQPHW